MSIVIFENPGEIDPLAISTFGVSVKEGDNPIGFFGRDGLAMPRDPDAIARYEATLAAVRAEMDAPMAQAAE